jgi:hypothetical protein
VGGTVRLTWRSALVTGVVAVGVACSNGTPTQPSPTPGTPAPPAAFSTNATIVDAVTGVALAGVSAGGADISGGPSGADGVLPIGSATGESMPRSVTLTRSGSVTRSLSVRVPGTQIVLSMIPSTFNLAAFDELLRVSNLRRWTSAPPLRIQSRVVQFTSVSAAQATGLTDVMSAAEMNRLEDDLTWALPRLTGDTFQMFAGVTRTTVDEGESMQVLNTGMITVARFQGLTAATGYWGYSRWQFQSDGTVIGGTIMLDQDFDSSSSPFIRSLRAHELGHALGYTHVTLITSVMNSNARTEPNTFDQQATRIAFQRSPGNVRPDAEPSGVSPNAARGAVWSRGEGAGRE